MSFDFEEFEAHVEAQQKKQFDQLMEIQGWLDSACLTTPLFSAYRADEQPSRIKRLERVWKKANEVIAILRGVVIPAGAVTRMHDHKGELTIEFKHEEWQDALYETFQLVWSQGESEPQLNFVNANEEGEFDIATRQDGCDTRPFYTIHGLEHADDLIGPDGEVYGHRD